MAINTTNNEPHHRHHLNHHNESTLLFGIGVNNVAHDVASGVRGFWIALTSLYDNLWRHTPEHSHVKRQLKAFVKGTTPLIIAMYSLLIISCFVLFPLFLGLLLITPGIIWSLFTMIPLWALNIYKQWHPRESHNLFIEQLKTLNPPLANQMMNRVSTSFPYERPPVRATVQKSTMLGRIRQLYRAIVNSLKRSNRFTSITLLLSLISFVPVVGSLVTIVGQTYLVSESLAAQLFEVYTKDYQRWDYYKREKWRRQHRWELFGFALPFTVLLSIPILGPFMLAFAQAGAADLFHRVITKNAIEKHEMEYSVQQSRDTQQQQEQKQEEQMPPPQKLTTSQP